MKQILVETSARHVHLTKEDFEALFGEGAELSVKKALSQPGQFASNEKVNLFGPKKSIMGVSILGPLRKATQIEIALTDARTLGVEALVRESGDIEGTQGIIIQNANDPTKQIEVSKGVIAAKRHIHATEADAEELGVKNGDIVSVKVESQDRSLIFGDVVVRVSNNFSLAMHIDTDESNAMHAQGQVFGEIVK